VLLILASNFTSFAINKRKKFVIIFLYLIIIYLICQVRILAGCYYYFLCKYNTTRLIFELTAEVIHFDVDVIDNVQTRIAMTSTAVIEALADLQN